MRTAKRLGLASVCVATAWLASCPALAADGTWTGSASTDYGTTNNWLDGYIAGGAGSTLNYKSAQTISLPLPSATAGTNVVLGNLVIPADAPGTAACLVSPGLGAYGRTEALVFDSGAAGVPATILNSCATNWSRMKIRADIRLNSDLFVSCATTNMLRYPNTMVYLTGNISDDGGKRGLIIANVDSNQQVAVFGNNTFEGDIEVRCGMLRAQAYDRLGGEGNQFGRNNTVIATNSASTVDLGGFQFGSDQSLLLAGGGVRNFGVLASGQQSPASTSVWSGPITLAGDVTVGKGASGTAGDGYPRYEGGAIALTGPVGEQGSGRRLIKTSLNALFLRGTNTYSGGTVLSDGYLCAGSKANLGTGAVFFNGGALLFETPWDVTSAGVVLTNFSGRDVKLRTADQNVTFNGVLGPFNANVWKSGLGTLTLTRTGSHNDFYVYSGALNLDYTGQIEPKLPSNKNVNFYNNANLNIVGGPQAFTNTVNGFTVNAGGAASIRLSGAAGTRFNLEGGAAGTVGAGASLDLSVQDGTALNMTRAAFDGADMLNSRMTYGGAAFVTKNAVSNVVAFSSASTNWDNAVPRHMDVTALTPATVPADAKIRTLRFNDPSAGTLTLAGDTGLTNGAILVTANMGATDVVIQGGTLTSVQGSELIVHQYNTQAVMRISSILTNGTLAAGLILTKTGPGTLVLEDVPNAFSNKIYVLGGTLEIASRQAFGATNRLVYVHNGATLRLRGTQFLGTSVFLGEFLFFNEAGGIIDVPEASDSVTFLAQAKSQSHGLLTKRGKGTLKFVQYWNVMAPDSFMDIRTKHYSIEEGTMEISPSATPMVFTGESIASLTVKNNAVLKGAKFLTGQGAVNGGPSAEDDQGTFLLNVDTTGGTVDLNGVSVNMGPFGNEVALCDYIVGSGRLTITNSSATAANVNLYGAHFNRFTGIFDGAKYLIKPTNGGGVPGGELTVPAGVSVDLGTQTFPYALAIGRLTGAGIFGGKNGDNHAMPPLLVGRDADETFEYAGFLWGTHNSASYTNYPFRYVKTGSNAWRVSGGTNAMTGDFTVRKGTLLVGTNSPGQGAAGALGKARAVVGDEGTLAGDSPALLTDGAYTVGNTLVLGGAAGTPTLGGNQTAGASLFTGALNLTRDVCLHAENTDAPNGVTFSGAVTGPGGITKTGPGTVYLTGAVSNAGPTAVQAGLLVLPGGTAVTNTLTVAAGSAGGGTLSVSGNLTLGPGATLAVSEAGTLTRGQTYTLLTWTGTRTGAFAAVTGLPQDWHVGYLANSLVLYYARPGSMIRVL